MSFIISLATFNPVLPLVDAGRDKLHVMLINSGKTRSNQQISEYGAAKVIAWSS